MVKLLWTGGWDSTFRLIQLAVKGAKVQPYYIILEDRRSTLKEIGQMSRIKKDLELKYNDCVINDTIFVVGSDVKISSEITSAYDKLIKDRFLGGQYPVLSALSDRVSGLELSIHRDDKAEYFVRKLDRESSYLNSDVFTIFGGFNYPIINYTKIKMEEEAKESGDIETLYKSWFCHTPINDTPCGYCNPCRYSIDEGMKKRFDFRGRLYNKAPILFKLFRVFLSKVI